MNFPPKKYQNINIQILIFGILFLIYNFGHTTFFYSSAYSSAHYQNFFFNFRFSSRTSQNQQKLAKKITHFTIQSHLKNLINFMNLNDIENNLLPQHSQKSFSLYKFSSKHVSVWCWKKHFQKWCSTIPWHPTTVFLKHFESKCLCISVYLRKKIFVWQSSKILYGGGWGVVVAEWFP